MRTTTDPDKRAFEFVKNLFKNDQGEPFEMTPGQIQVFRAIYEKQNPRVIVECYTQYGKSEVIAMALLLRATTFPEKWVIIGGTRDKASIIQQKVIKHLFENDYTLGKFQIGKDESLERIKRERSKDRVTFRVDDEGNIGEVMILSADAKRVGEDAGDILIGHGAPNVVEDDAALIPDDIHGKVLRMLGGHTENFLVKITNPFGRNHAWQSLNDPSYKTIVIPWEQGVTEGRITAEFVEEMRRALDPIMFGILYECKHPPADLVDEQGWMPLFTEADLQEAQSRSVEATGYKRLGGDIAEGTNYSAFCLRFDNLARIHSKTLESDLMKTAEHIATILTEERIKPDHCFLDAIGVGSGVVSRLHEQGLKVSGIKVGEKPTEVRTTTPTPVEYANLRAELYWKAREWVRQGGALEPHEDWKQLLKIRYKEDASKRIKMMTKEEMHARGILSPSESTDIPDAFVLTFAPMPVTTYGKASPLYPSERIGEGRASPLPPSEWIKYPDLGF